MKKIFLTLLAAASLLPAVSAKETLVKRQDLAVAPVWKQRIINGKELIPMLKAHTWSYGGKAWSFGWKSYGPDPKLPVYKASGVFHIAHRRIINELKRGGPYAVKADPIMRGKKVKLLDFFHKVHGNGLMETHKLHTPVMMLIGESRPVFVQNEKYEHDMKSYLDWKKAHPNFIAFRALGELDSDISQYMRWIHRMPDGPIRKRILERFPLPNDQYEYMELVEKAFAQQQKFFFGEKRFWTLSSSSFLGHIMAQMGSVGFSYEATGQDVARWQVAGAFTRGASRQFDIPFGWYVANWYTGYTRKGKLTNGENRWVGKGGQNAPHMGTGRSLINRQNFYGYLIGCALLEHENWPWLHIAGKPRQGIPSPNAHDFNDLYKFSVKNTRGTPYTPIAFLTPISHYYSATGWPGTNRYAFKDIYTLNAFFYTLVPIGAEDIKHRSLRKKGYQGCFFNSPFGEIYDVICPDAEQDAKTIAKVLSAYKAAFLLSEYRKGELKVAALKEYVKNGGTLFISSNYIREGVIGSDFAGLKAGKDNIPSGKYLVGLSGEKIPLKDVYFWTQVTPLKAKVILKDEKGNAVAYANNYGKGKVITIASYKMLPHKYHNARKTDLGKEMRNIVSGKQTFELIKYLLTQVQKETFPVTLKGDVQYGLNKTKKGYLLWLMNHKGVVKFTYEPEIYQKEKTAQILADISRLKGKKAYDMWTGKKVDIKNGKLNLSVAPGAIRLIAIE